MNGLQLTGSWRRFLQKSPEGLGVEVTGRALQKAFWHIGNGTLNNAQENLQLGSLSNTPSQTWPFSDITHHQLQTLRAREVTQYLSVCNWVGLLEITPSRLTNNMAFLFKEKYSIHLPHTLMPHFVYLIIWTSGLLSPFGYHVWSCCGYEYINISMQRLKT